MGRTLMSGSAQEIGALAIGTVLGGSTLDNRGWIKAAKELQRDAILARANVSSSINVEVVFQIPGNILAPDYEGIRTGTYWRSESLLQIQVALPAAAPVDPRSALIRWLWDALDLVDSWAVTKGKSVDTTALRGIVAEIERLNV